MIRPKERNRASRPGAAGRGDEGMTGKVRYVHCKVSLGFFETEFYVRLDDSSAYVDRTNVRVGKPPEPGAEIEGQVLAYVIDNGGSSDKALVEIPGEPVIGGLRSWVSKSTFATA